MVAILPANSVSDSGYEVSNSLMFTPTGSGSYLNRTTSTATNTKIFTYSVWLKRSNLGDINIFNGDDGSDGNNNFDAFYFRADHKIFLYGYAGGDRISIVTNRVFRDVSAWYHLVLACDTTQSSANDRIKLYVNGVQETSFDPHTQPSQNMETYFNGSSIRQQIGRYPDSSSLHFDGYMSEINFVDGQQLSPTSFGESDDNGQWVPIKYTGTYGNNGFYHEFKQTGTSQNSSGIGADTSGNDNHFAVNNIASTDVSTDTCTNNFMTLNSQAKASLAGNPTKGALVHTGQTSGYAQTVLGTLAWHGSGGKWYWEMEQGGGAAGNYGFIRTDKPDGTNGVGNIIQTTSSTPTECVTYDWAWGVNPSNGNSRHDNNSVSYGSGLSSGDHGMVAVDTVAGKVWWGKNGTWFNSGDPANGTNPAFTDSDITEGLFTIYSIVSDTDGRIKRYNFGNPPTDFAIASGNSDANGYGNFEYAPPSGYFALCTKNLAEFG